MPEFTPRANLYLPGGGLSGTIPDEEVDIDRINSNFRILDELIGALPVTSTTRPSAPVNGQLIYETNTRNTLQYSSAQLKWLALGSVNAPSEVYRNDIFGATPAAGSRCFRLDLGYEETYYATAVPTGWYPSDGQGPKVVAKKALAQDVTTARTLIKWGAEVADSSDMHSTAQDTRITAPVKGIYEVEVAISQSGTTALNATSSVNGSLPRAVTLSDARTGTTGASASPRLIGFVEMDAGEYLEVGVTTAAGTVSILSSSTWVKAKYFAPPTS